MAPSHNAKCDRRTGGTDMRTLRGRVPCFFTKQNSPGGAATSALPMTALWFLNFSRTMHLYLLLPTYYARNCLLLRYSIVKNFRLTSDHSYMLKCQTENIPIYRKCSCSLLLREHDSVLQSQSCTLACTANVTIQITNWNLNRFVEV